ncbi:hemerythrin domain-containing protein [Massilia sp. DWR3-1-1]|uniref:hemerythrin domain-containing protein n=1 Tax=Massilia sp. DWR3-1-1 TaxID=2804559 RepID=UPI003CF5AEB8
MNQPKDAIALLTADHEEARALFSKYEELGERAWVSKKKLATEVCQALTVHAQIEEEIFYPALRTQGKPFQDLLDEAQVEHAGAKALIAQIEAMAPQDDLYDAKVKVLGEQIDHHATEEEDEMFPKCRKTTLDLVALGEQLLARKLALMASL